MNRTDGLTRELCALYERAGFRNYKMRKFEEYSLYLENKDFLTSEQVITFHDPSGRLLALKPDVTLSIVKNTKASATSSEKVYYTESVYRMDTETHEFREIHQVGLEMLGRIDAVASLDILTAALHSLEAVSGEYLLCLSHMGLTAAAIDRAAGGSTSLRAKLLAAVRAKSRHELQTICAEGGVDPVSAEQLLALAEIDGDFAAALAEVKALSLPDTEEAVAELSLLLDGLSACGLAGRVRLDLSMMNDSSYYNGIIFQGYLADVHRHVLSGGRYDRLARKFRQDIGAMGFALYLSDLAARGKSAEYDCDLLLLYGEDTPAAEVLAMAEDVRAKGLSVRVERTLPSGLRAKEVREV